MKWIHAWSFVVVLGLAGIRGSAQKTFPVDGIRDNRTGYTAFQHATVVPAPGIEIKDGTLIIKKGKIEYAGTAHNTPAGAVEVNCRGRYIYPSFIDLDSDYGLKKAVFDPKKPTSGPKGWNQAIKCDFDAFDHFIQDTAEMKKYLKAGFGTVLTHRHDGISRGSGALVMVGDMPNSEAFIKERASHYLSFKKGRSKQKYPGSLMGVIALLRQTYYDADWYRRYGYKEETNSSLEAWNALQPLPQILETDHFLDIFRGDQIAGEFDRKYIYRGSGEEYRRPKAIAKVAGRIILPLQYPNPMNLRNPLTAPYAGLAEMKHWEWAPFNAGVLSRAGVQLALTMRGMKHPAEFHKAVTKTIRHRWSEEEALRALTITPARWLGVVDKTGSLEAGKLANFLITDGPLFHTGTKILQNWVKGHPHILIRFPLLDIEGEYAAEMDGQEMRIVVDHRKGVKGFVHPSDTAGVPIKIGRSGKLLTLSYKQKSGGIVRLEGRREGMNWQGTGVRPDGTTFDWSARWRGPVKRPAEKKKTEPELPKLRFPFVAFGWDDLPQEQDFLVKNTTVWTNTKDGIRTGVDVLVLNGKISRVAKNIPQPKGEVIVIDGTGMHLTNGIIDEHSHIAIKRGVNECTQAVTAEVRIGDVINSEDVNIYRQLAGGVTTSQLLHGSCNPIGGQSAIIKLRWGRLPEELKLRGADPFIKFALGENVKRSRIANNKRYPNTRMGVAQIYDDAFTMAKQYELERMKNPAGTRVDLEMQTIAEIINKKRFVTCHSYVQSEINMLMHMAVKHGFRINTFTHGLEAYKVADKIRAHGAGASVFSDWWAYKYEVKDAIPYNATLLTKMGVVTAVNSDDAEMGRRLNQEAAKSVKYGGLTEEEAWKLVTLNPAKLLHLDDRLGTLEPGKDADLVLWNANPLSVYALPQMTWVDGVRYYDRNTEEQMNRQMEAERNRLTQLMLQEAQKTGKTQAVKASEPHHYHCDDARDEGNGEGW